MTRIIEPKDIPIGRTPDKFTKLYHLPQAAIAAWAIIIYAREQKRWDDLDYSDFILRSTAYMINEQWLEISSGYLKLISLDHIRQRIERDKKKFDVTEEFIELCVTYIL